MPPAAPTIRKRPKSTLGTLEFWWNTSAVSGYILRCAGEPDRNYGPTVGYAAVTGLTNSTNYSFSLIATQSGVESPPSYFRTAQPGVLTGPPTNVQFTPSISNNVGVLTVTWDPPTPVANQSAVGWYIIRAVPTSGPTIVQGAHYYDRIRVIGGLDETKTYTCSLQAINSGGYGAPLVDTVPFGNTAVLSLWLDARDLNTMFEDREGTIPVSDPDTLVLRWNDKSGRNNNFIAVEGTPGVPVYVNSLADSISLNAASMSSLFALSATNTLTIVSVYTIESASPIPVISNIFKRDSANASNLDLNVDIEENMISKYKFGSDFTTIQMRPPFSQNTGGTLLNIVSTSNNTDTISSLYPPVGASPVSQSGRPSLASSQTYLLGDSSENNVTLLMHELRVYDGILDQGALNTLNNQLAIKWGASDFPILASSLVQGHIQADTGGDSVTVVDGSGLILVSGFSFMMNGVEVGNSIRWQSINVLSFGSGSPVDSTWPANRGAAILLGNANRKLINLYKTSAMVQVGNYNIIRLYAEFNNDTGNTVEGAMEIRLIKDRVNGNQFIEVCVHEGRGTNHNGAISTPGVWNITNGTSYLNTFATTDFSLRFPADDTSFVLASDASGIQWGVNYQNFMYLNKSLNTPDDGVSVVITRTGDLVVDTPISFGVEFPGGGQYEYVTGTWIVYDSNEDEIYRDTDSQQTLFYTFTEVGDYTVEYELQTRNTIYRDYDGPFTVEDTPTPPTLLSIECNGSFSSPVVGSEVTFAVEYTGTLTGTDEWFIDGLSSGIDTNNSFTHTFGAAGQYVISYVLTDGLSTYDISQTYFAVAASGDNIVLSQAKAVNKFHVPTSYTAANLSLRGGGGGGGRGGDLGSSIGGGGGGAGGSITGTFDISVGAILDARGGAAGALGNIGNGGRGGTTFILSTGAQVFDLSGTGGFGGLSGTNGGSGGSGGIATATGIIGLTVSTGANGSPHAGAGGGAGASPNGGTGGDEDDTGGNGGAGSFTLTLSGSPPTPPILLSITCTENPPLKNAEVTFTVDTSGPIEGYITDTWYVDDVSGATNTTNSFNKTFNTSGQYVISYSLTTGAGTFDISQTYYVVDAVNDDIILTQAKPVTNFLVPPSYTAAEVISLLGGGGGGGGGGGDGELGGGGGGGGGEITGTFDISAGAILDITKGGGGTAGLVSEGGGAGGTTGIYSTGAQTFTLYSEGGYGGSDGTMMGGGAGGAGGATSSTGTINTATLTLTEGTAGNQSGGTNGGSGSGNGGRGGDQQLPGFSPGGAGEFTLKLSFSGATPPINIVDLSAVDISSSGFALIWGEGSSSSGANQSEFLSATTGTVLAVPSLQYIAGRRIEYYYPNGYQGIVYNGYLRLSNGPAFDMSSNIITFNTPVDPPTNLAISGITTAGATLSFDDLSGLGYSVDISGPGAPPIVTPEYPFLITGLEPYSYYTAFLTATSSPGNIDSNPASISFTTLPEAPINFPADLSANPINDTSAVITWTTPTDVVTNIRIEDANSGNIPPDISDNCNGVNYTITGLTANTSYSLDVYFGNASGYGPSAPLSFTTTPPPDIIYSGFSTPSEIQMPAGYNKLEYIICGGGGGGGAGDNSGGGGLGGLGGAQSNPVTDILTVESGIQIYIVVGLGGDGGTGNLAGGQMGGNTSITIGPSPYSSSGGTGGSFASSETGDGGAGGYNTLTVDSNPIYAGNGGGGGGGEGYVVQGIGGIRGSQARTPLTGGGNDTTGANWSGGPYTPGGRGGDGYYYIRIFYEAP